VELAEAAQEREMGFAPVNHIVVVVVRSDGGAHDQQQHLGQRMGDAPGMTRVRHRAEMVQQVARAGLLGERVHLRLRITRETRANHNQPSTGNRR